MRRPDFDEFLTLLTQRLAGHSRSWLMKIVDGKALEVSHNTTDPDAAWGRGVSRIAKGYKLHAICSGNDLPDAFIITPLNVCEKQMAAGMIEQIQREQSSGGYLLADSHFDASWLYDHCAGHNHQLLCPRPRPGTGLGHHHQSPRRLQAIDMLESPQGLNAFGTELYRRRSDIERNFSNLVTFGGGLTVLPSWVRRIWRVRRWVWGKLLIRAARTRCQRKARIAA